MFCGSGAFKFFTRDPTQRITFIHLWTAFRHMMTQFLVVLFRSPWEVHNIFHLLDIGGFLQQTETLTAPRAPLSLLAEAARPLRAHIEWENSFQLLFDLFWLWRKIYRVFVVIFGPARQDFAPSQRPPQLLFCVIINHVIFIPTVSQSPWESWFVNKFLAFGDFFKKTNKKKAWAQRNAPRIVSTVLIVANCVLTHQSPFSQKEPRRRHKSHNTQVYECNSGGAW